MKCASIIDCIGNTPLVNVDLATPPTILAKLEYMNPGGSLKDRSAKYMIEQAERDGFLQPGGTIIEASSGNQGIATAMIGASKGYRVIITVSSKVSQEKQATLRAYGAEVVVCKTTDFLEDPESYHSVALRIQAQTPNSYMLNQYFNANNSNGHYSSLGPEIWEQTEGKITHFCSAVGSGGHVSGAGRYLKSKNPNIVVVGVDSACSYRSTNGNPQPYKLEGMGVDFDAPNVDKNVIDEFLTVSDDEALCMLKELAHKHGFLVGPASGATAYAVKKYSKNLKPSDVLVTVFGDSGRAYLTKNFYS